MDMPLGYIVSNESKIVCKLQRALYGLKQSPHTWFGRFSLALKKHEFSQSNFDYTLFFKHKNGKVTKLLIYVDNMIITGNDSKEI